MKFQSEDILENNYNDIPEDAHVLHLWEPLSSNITEDYSFVHDSFIFNFFSNLLYVIAFPILWLYTKVFLDFKITGKENLTSVKGSKITVSNHVHFLDCVMNGLANFPKKTFFISLESNFRIPIVKTLITLLNAIPIPDKTQFKAKFIESLDNLLKRNKTIHFYPEGSLWPYYDEIRHFKNGAFNIAVRNNVPIIPFVFHFVKPYGFRKFFRKKPFVHLDILSPEYPSIDLPKKESIEELKIRVFKKMYNHIK